MKRSLPVRIVVSLLVCGLVGMALAASAEGVQQRMQRAGQVTVGVSAG